MANLLHFWLLLVKCAWLFAAELHDGDVINMLAPYDGSTLVTSQLLVLVHFPVPGYQLVDNEWVLCMRTNLSGKDEELCWDSYDGASIASTNHTFAKFLPVNESGDYFVETLLEPSISGSSISKKSFLVRSDFSVVQPFNREMKAEKYTIADFTYVNDISFDLMRMRIREHQSDFVLLVDSNETHSGLLEKQFVFPPSTGSSDNGLPPHSAAGSTVKVSAAEFLNRTQIEPWYLYRGSDKELEILVHHPAPQPEVKLREPMHRNALSDAARRLQAHNFNTGARNPDMYIVSDTDEIVHRKAIRTLKGIGLLHGANTRETIVFLQLDFHLYNFNWKFPNQQWGLFAQEGAFVAPASLVRRFTSSAPAVNASANDAPATAITASGVRRLLRPVNRQLLLQLASEYNIVYWDHAGWHLSRFNSAADMARAKSMAFTHKEAEFMSKMWTEENCAIMQDMGIPHFLLEGGKGGIPYITEGQNPLLFYPSIVPPFVRRDSTNDTGPAQSPCTPHAVAEFRDDATCTAASTHSSSVSVHGERLRNAVFGTAVDVWEREHHVTLPVAVYEDLALFQRNVHRVYGAPRFTNQPIDLSDGKLLGPDPQSRRSAAERLVDIYSAALPPSDEGAQVIYTAAPDAGTFVKFSCFRANNVRLDSALISDTRTVAEQERDFYRAEVIEKLFCGDLTRCPYKRSEEAIIFVIPWVQSKCESTQGKFAYIKVHSK